MAKCTDMCEAAGKAGVKLVCRQTYSMGPDIQELVAIVRSSELGRLIAINSWMYTDWLLKPGVAEELDETMSGAVVYRPAPHLIDTIQLLDGCMVRSVRAQVERWMAQRPAPGNFSAFMEFEGGTLAIIAYNGYAISILLN